MNLSSLLAAIFLLGCLLTPNTSRADVSFIVVLTVPEENTDAFDKLATRMAEASAKDEGLLLYEFARVGTTVYGYERYTDEEAHDRHEALLEPFLEELTTLAKFEKIVTLTPLSDKKAAAMAEIAALIGKPIAGAAQGKLGEGERD